MERRKLLIADASDEFPMALQAVLQDSHRIQHCGDGTEALQMLEHFRPDAMILDPLLPGMDGIELLRRAQGCYVPPVILVVTRVAGTYILDALEKLQVSYVMMKPCKPAAVADRLTELMQQDTGLPNRTEVQQRLDKLLPQWGFPIHSSGYRCVREAVAEEFSEPGQQVTKTLYPAVAKRCGGNPEQVEQAIRRLIRRAWRYRDAAQWQGLFPACLDIQTKCPTNKEFIVAAAAYLLVDFQEKDTYLDKIG